MEAWAALKAGEPNPLVEALAHDADVLAHATPEEATGWLDASVYVGAAPTRCRRLVASVRAQLAATALPEVP